MPLTRITYNTAEVPRSDRFDYWQNCVSSTHAPLTLDSDDRQGFQAFQRTLEVDGIRAWPTVFKPVVFRRNRRQIRQSDPECYHFSFVFMGRLEGVFGGRVCDVGMNEVSIFDTSTVFEVEAARGHREQRGIGLEVPRSILKVPAGSVEVLRGGKVSSDAGYGLLLKQFLRTLVSGSSDFGERDGSHISCAISDLVSGLLANAAGVGEKLPIQTRQRVLLMSIKRLIESRIGDPDLTLRDVADAHHISLGYLHRIFGEEEETASAWILRRRLENAYADLVDPELSGVPVYQISEKWGFKSPPVFSRSFRKAYGVTPREVRP